MTAVLRSSVLTFLLMVVGCKEGGSPVDSDIDGTVDVDGSPAGDARVALDGSVADSAMVPDETDSWCLSARGGAPGPSSPSALSVAHANVRFFGVHGTYNTADNALIEALAFEDETVSDTLRRYAETLGDVCVRPASSIALSEVRVSWDALTATVVPGSGEVEDLSKAERVVVDLRELAGGSAQVRDALNPILAQVLDKQPVDGLSMRVRHHYGFTDEVFSPNRAGIYSQQLEVIPPEVFVGLAESSPELVLLVGESIAPEAARVAASLRLARRAWLVGAPLAAHVVESEWSSVGEEGIVYRAADALHGGVRIGDHIPADYPTLDQVPRESSLAPVDWDAEPQRTPMSELDVAASRPSTVNLGAARAALFVLHGTLRFFFPYFEVVGDHIDARLNETVENLPRSPARIDLVRALERFSEVLDDGHSWVRDSQQQAQPGTTIINVVPDGLADRILVRKSSSSYLAAGDAILSIDGVGIADWYDEKARFISASSEGARRYVSASNFVYSAPIGAVLGVADPDGVQRTETVIDESFDRNLHVGWTSQASSRPSGWLTDLGFPNVYYLNLDGSVATSGSATLAHVRASYGAERTVVDMRGYPAPMTEVLDYITAENILAGGDAQSPMFGVLGYLGPNGHYKDSSQYSYESPGKERHPGPLALLVSPGSQSAAENFMSVLTTNREDVTVVGRPSSGTNGNITGVRLPGDIGVTFTGMEVKFPNGRTFHKVGIVPDLRVVPSAQDMRAGVDTVLMAALTAQ